MLVSYNLFIQQKDKLCTEINNHKFLLFSFFFAFYYALYKVDIV